MEDDPRLKGETVKKWIRSNFCEELDCAHYILNKSLIIMDHSKKVYHDKEVVAHALITALHTKAYTTFHAILVLCEEGFDRDALAMVRNLLEILITILYILKDDPEKRAIYYACEEFRKSAAYIAASKKHFQQKNTDELKKNVDEKMDQLRPEYSQYIDDLNTSRNPFRKIRIKDMAEQVGMNMIYDFLYSYLSEFVHPNMIGLKSYTAGKSEESFTVKPGRGYEKLDDALKYACRFYLDILRAWNHCNKLNKEEVIKELEDKKDKTFLKGQ